MEENSAPLISFSGADILGGEDNVVVYGLDLQVYPGQVVYIIGKVGSGKTSIFRTITAENPLGRGAGKVCGYDLTALRTKDVPQRVECRGTGSSTHCHGYEIYSGGNRWNHRFRRK